MTRRRWLRRAGVVVALAIAAFLLDRQLAGFSFAQLRAAWTATPATAIAASLALTTLSFACLAAFEWLAVRRHAPGRIPPAVAMRVGVQAHAIANCLGFHALTGVGVRLHAYARHGVDTGDVARIVATILGCIACGVVAVTVAALAWLNPVPAAWVIAFVAAVAILFANARRPGWLRTGRPARIARDLTWVSLLGLVEMMATIAALHVLLPAAMAPPPATFALVFVGAMLFGIVSHVPGGLGVFEAGILAGIPQADATRVLAALLLFRAIYNLLPFALAAGSLGVGWLRRRWLSWTAGRPGSRAAGAGTTAPAPERRSDDGRAHGSPR